MKYPKNTRAGMVSRKRNREQFNPNTGLPHSREHLEYERSWGRRRARRFAYATSERTGGIK